jgi:hypothetical protein
MSGSLEVSTARLHNTKIPEKDKTHGPQHTTS